MPPPGFWARVRDARLVRVFVVYLAASWLVLQVTALLRNELYLPRWVTPLVVLLLLVGLVIITATAWVLSHPRTKVMEGERPAAWEIDLKGFLKSLARLRVPHLTWARAILGGALAFATVALVSAVIVIQGAPRVTDAYGAAGDVLGDRPWVLVADLGAPADERELAVAVREALTVDLQQSNHVKVYTRAQILGVLRFMELPDTVTVTGTLALEITQREGLGAVLAGRLSRLGDDYVVAARVLQPGMDEELVAVRVTAARERLVDGVERLSREIRLRLGESRGALRASQPLPRVTTRSVDALERYAQAVETLSRGEQQQALDLAVAAIALDPEFAMAYRLAGVTNWNLARYAEAERHATRAHELREKLSERERLHIEAWYAQVVLVDPLQAIAKYELLLSAYPDDWRAANNLAVNAFDVGDHERAHRSALQAIRLNPYSTLAYGNAIVSGQALGRWAVVDSLATLAMARGLTESGVRYLWGQAVARRDWARAEVVCDSLLAHTSPRGERRAEDQMGCGALDLARGRTARALERLQRAADLRSERDQLLLYHWTTFFLVHAELLRGRRHEAQRALEGALARHPLASIAKPDGFWATYWAVSSAAQLGDVAAARRHAAAYPADSAKWDEAAGALRLRAVVELAAGAYAAALDYDRAGVRRAFGADLSLDQLYRAQAFDALGQRDSAIALYEAAADRRSIARPPWIRSFYLAHLPLIHRRLGDLYAEAGEAAKAARHYEAFIELWADCDPELRTEVAAARRALAKLAQESTRG